MDLKGMLLQENYIRPKLFYRVTTARWENCNWLKIKKIKSIYFAIMGF